ncbi:MAG: 4-hydroxy-tetrahydrodipicolinate reductase, partial [Kiloniellales bacterium]|nr:4-hydroxy-tetrahydrodipicolinate reductase [Kiloniellales bacterium]
MTKIGVVGCAGRMGRMNMRVILENEEAVLSGGTEMPGSEWLGRDLGTLAGSSEVGLLVEDDPAKLFAASDVIVDFTTAAAARLHLEEAARSGTPLVLGTTGLGNDDQKYIRQTAGRVAVLQAANMSFGVNLLAVLVERAARVLGPDYDIEVLEMHHRHKVDAPSGTALALGEAAAVGRSVHLDEVARKSREGITGARLPGEIGFATLRGGDVPGEHSVIFAGEGERIELTHKAGSRELFSRGAIKAALWLRGRAPGLYTMRDV